MDTKETDIKSNIELAFTDELTGLYNRRYLNSSLPELISKSEKLSLFMIDLDGFKGVNDNYGHLEGDKILVEFSKILTQAVGKDGIVTRYAGDEFTVLLPDKGKEEAVLIANKVLKNVSSQPLKGDKKVHLLTLSLGIAIYPDDAKKPVDMIDKADQALYSSKKSGKNKVSTVDEIVSEVAVLDGALKDLSYPKFVNRQDEISRLEKLLESSFSGNKKGVLISGESGIGKTRLLDEFVSLKQSKGISVIKVRATEDDLYRAHGLVSACILAYLKGLKAKAAAEFIDTLDKEELAILRDLIPSVQELLPDKKTNIATGSLTKAFDLFRGLVKIFEKIIGKQNFVLAIDDFCFIDADSLAVFYYLLKNPKLNIFLCGTFLEVKGISVEESVKSKTPFEMLRLNPQRFSVFQEISLGPLTLENITELLVIIFKGMALSGTFVEDVYDKTQGNPFYVLEILKLFINKGSIYFKNGVWNLTQIYKNDIPVSFADLKKSQLDSLDTELKEFLVNASSIGESFNLDMLKKAFQMNEGYLLDVIEKAKKIGVISPKDSQNVDEYSFVNSRTKDTLYNLLDKSKARDLHKKLAVILEDYYRNDLDMKAAKILPHYEKSETQSKVSEYLNRITSGQGYQRAMGYIDSTLKEEAPPSIEEILEKPLSPEGKQLLYEAITAFRAAIASALLYKPGNLPRINSQEEAFVRISKILEYDVSITFSKVGDELLVNGEELVKKEWRKTLGFAFATILSDHRIASLTFKRGLTKDEFAFFLDNLAKPEEYIKGKGGFSNILKENNIIYVKIDEVHYEKVSGLAIKLKDAGRALRDIALKDPLLKQLVDPDKEGFVLKAVSSADLIGIMESLKGMVGQIAQGEGEVDEKSDMILEVMQKIGTQASHINPKLWGELKGELAKKFASLDPQIKGTILKKEISSLAPGGIMGDVLAGSTDAGAKDIINTAISNFKTNKISLKELKNFLGVILSDPLKKEKMLAIMEQELINCGVSKDDIAYLFSKEPKQEKSSAIDDIASDFLSSSGKRYFDHDVSKNIRPVIEGLILKDKDETIIRIIEKVSLDLENSAPNIRSSALRGLGDITDILLDKEKFSLIEIVVKRLLLKMRSEDDTKNYGLIAMQLGKLASGIIYKEDYKLAKDIVKALREELLRIASKEAGLKKYIQDALKSIAAQDVIDLLVRELSKNIELEAMDITEFLVELGEDALEALIRLLEEEDVKKDPFEAYKVRRSAAMVLKKMGKSAIYKMKDKLSDRKPACVKNIIEALGFIADESAVQFLHDVSKHGNNMVKRELIVALRKIGGLESIKLLAGFLKDKDEDMRQKAISAIVDLSEQSTIVELEHFLSDKDISQDIKKIIEEIKKKFQDKDSN